MTERLMTSAEVGDLLALTSGALAQLRYMGTGPKFVKLGGRAVRYRREDLDEWIARHTRERTGGHR